MRIQGLFTKGLFGREKLDFQNFNTYKQNGSNFNNSDEKLQRMNQKEALEWRTGRFLQ